MKVKKIPARDCHVGMTMVAGGKEDFTLHAITEVHLKPKENEGFLKVQGRTAPIPFKIDQAFIRVVNTEGENSEHYQSGEHRSNKVS